MTVAGRLTEGRLGSGLDEAGDASAMWDALLQNMLPTVRQRQAFIAMPGDRFCRAITTATMIRHLAMQEKITNSRGHVPSVSEFVATLLLVPCNARLYISTL